MGLGKICKSASKAVTKPIKKVASTAKDLGNAIGGGNGLGIMNLFAPQLAFANSEQGMSMFAGVAGMAGLGGAGGLAGMAGGGGLGGLAGGAGGEANIFAAASSLAGAGGGATAGGTAASNPEVELLKLALNIAGGGGGNTLGLG